MTRRKAGKACEQPDSPHPRPLPVRLTAGGLIASLIVNLVACGGGTDAAPTAAPASAHPSSRGADALAAAVAKAAPQLHIQPSFHMAPAQPAEPGPMDEGGTNASAHLAPARTSVNSADVAGLDSARLTPEVLQAHWAGLRAEALGAARRAAASTGARPATSSITNYVTFTPAQIRAAYLLPALPTVGATLSAADAAALGAGQTVYVLDAFHLAGALTGLNAFSTRFGLPPCNAVPITTGTALPLARPSASTTSCDFSVAYLDGSANISNTAPATDSGWNSESALDIQWVHAIAPLARIVLIEAANAGNSLTNAISVANRMGPGTVSMSWGSQESGSNTSLEGLFTAAGMTYFASTGDAGTEVNWPAASPSVTAVGGTSLGYDGTARYETAWSKAGGGISSVFGLPSYQSGFRMAGTALPRRAVADVAMNADPNTGQYVAMLGANNAVGWYTMGGTSMSTPMWAGLNAVANAQRVAAGKSVLGDVHALLYTTIASVPGRYASGFNDVSAGANGACALCASGTGFDQATGLGTPNATALWGLMVGSAAPPLPAALPDVAVGTAFQVQWATTDTTDGSTLSYAASGVPAGMTVSSTGKVSGSIATAGSYSFSVTVQSSSGGQASGTVSIKAAVVNHAPTLAGGAITFYTGSGAQQTAITGADADGDPLTYTMTGAPAGLTLSTSGLLAWAAPVKGSYPLVITAKDPGGLKGTASYSLTVRAPNKAPVVTAATLSGKVGTALSAQITATDANGDALAYSLSGAPDGMAIGAKGVLTWASPVAGSYAPVVTATDPGGLSGSATITVNVTQPNRAPVLKGAALPGGYTGQAYSAQIVATDADGDALTYTATGMPAGLTVSRAGDVAWPAPVKGSYTLAVTVKDPKGGAATASFTLKVTVPPAAPKISLAPVNGKVGTAIAVMSTFSDANGDALTFSVIGAPDGMTMGPKGGLNWPTPVAGVYRVTLVATDPGGLTGTADVTVTVVQPNRAPTVAAATLTGAAGAAFSAQVTGSDADGDALTYSMTGGPTGLSLSSAGGLSWDKAVKGSYTLTVTAKDPSGAKGSGTIKLVIS